MITSFTIRKEIECKTTDIAKSQVDSLAELEEKKEESVLVEGSSKEKEGVS